MKRDLEYWRSDSAAAWDKCEERRLSEHRLRASLLDGLKRLDSSLQCLRQAGYQTSADEKWLAKTRAGLAENGEDSR